MAKQSAATTKHKQLLAAPSESSPSATHRLPVVTVKYAQTLDGRIATATGHSQWISCPQTLRLAHRLRREHDAILVGIGTLLHDDPRLTVRLVGGRSPVRIIVDAQLQTPITARVLRERTSQSTLIVTSQAADPARARQLQESGAEIIFTSSAKSSKSSSHIDLKKMLRLLAKRGIESVLVEGGSGIITALLRAKLVDRMVIVTAPKLIGRGIEAVGELGIRELHDAITFSSYRTRRLGEDWVFDGWIDKS